ncbi:rod-binding protein [Sphingomonas sp. AX6]|uniref:rod-binding protein n=1 Tax=Sphingomonas sp. AX6 TaxID=2653171 RepID=UPI0012EFBCD4|nr:rod-binding protein [Sphingomonas sp. AX6]VXC70788.1 hypothetical protein SPHINGOAX6_40091 [Sphingomonas sp. AX6]
MTGGMNIPGLNPAASQSLRLDGVAGDTSRLANADNLKAAGERFEAIFVNMMLTSMRKASLGEGLFDTKAVEQFRDMQDQKLAETMASSTPIGIGKAMTDFLSKAQPTLVSPETTGDSTPDKAVDG